MKTNLLNGKASYLVELQPDYKEASTITVAKNVTGDEQESNFQNACLSVHGMQAISFAVRAPNGVEKLSQDQLEAKFRADFHHLAQQGYIIEVQIGRD